jgi:broad specificity phosphatase PhoE
MPPQKLMLIRHAEKPVNPPPGGVNEQGTPDSHSLTPRGWQRAGALVPFFVLPDKAKGIESPAILYAAGVGGAAFVIDGEDASKSERPQQTLLPLSERLAPNVPFITTFFLGQEAQLVADIQTRTGVVLVAWEHKHIPDIASAVCPQAPQSWPDDRFDVVWILDQVAADGYAFNQVNQTLLSGDQ